MNLSPFCHWNYVYPFWYIVGKIKTRHLVYVTTCIVIQPIIIIILLQIIRYSKCHVCGVCKYIECEFRCMEVWIKNSKPGQFENSCESHNMYAIITHIHYAYPYLTWIAIYSHKWLAYVTSHCNTTWYIFWSKFVRIKRHSSCLKWRLVIHCMPCNSFYCSNARH